MTLKEFKIQYALGALDWYDIREMANDPLTSTEVLKDLSTFDDISITHRVAKNPNTTVDALKILSKNKYWLIRSNVAKNPNTPIDILTTLSKDKSRDIRLYLVKNPKISIYMLKNLTKDKDWYVAWNATELLNKRKKERKKELNDLKRV